MCKTAIVALMLGASTQAAVIRGVVVEKQTGYLLSRAVVTLQPIAVAGQSERTIRTNDAGLFEFPGLPLGSYLVKASRRGFMPGEYGQKRWNSAGMPIVIVKDDTISVRMVMSRYGAITGTVRDANEAGIPGQDVAAYTATQPPQLMVRTKSDDRGVYRLGGLPPGTYMVRTTGNEDDDRSYRPTFSRQSATAAGARTVMVYPDEDTNDGDVRPMPGNLFELSGTAAAPAGFMVTVTLASDMGRIVVQGSMFHFGPLPPGRYELYAEGRDSSGMRYVGGFSEVNLNRTIERMALPMNDVPESRIVAEGAGPDVAMTGFLRRIDMAGAGTVQPLKMGTQSRAIIMPGRWELRFVAPEGFYISRAPFIQSNSRADGWNEIQVRGAGTYMVTLARGGGILHGTVKSSGAPAAGAPVFLEAWDTFTRKRLAELRQTRTDANGAYRFDGLPPGDYRILSTFEYAEPDAAALDLAQAQSVHVDANGDRQMDLGLYGIP